MAQDQERHQEVLAWGSQQRRWTWRAALKQARQVLSDEGVKSLGCRILSETLYRRVIMMERLLHKPIDEVTSALPVVIDRLKPTEIDGYVSFRLGTDPLLVRRRLSVGQRAFVARHEARIVHAGWTTTKQAWIDFLAREITLAPDEVYQYESFTAPSFRGQNLVAVRITEMLHYFREAGYRRMIAVVVPEISAAFRPLEKTGFRPFGILGYVQLGRWRRHFCWVNRHALTPGGALTSHRTRTEHCHGNSSPQRVLACLLCRAVARPSATARCLSIFPVRKPGRVHASTHWRAWWRAACNVRDVKPTTEKDGAFVPCVERRWF